MISKRQLGIGVSVGGVFVLVGTIAVDVVGAGRWVGFGPLQRIGIVISMALVGVGLTLVPLGNRPA